MKNALFVLILCLAGSSAQAASISLTAPGVVNGRFTVDVLASDVFTAPHDDPDDALLAFGFDLSYDSSLLSFFSETTGPQFDDISGNVPPPTADVAGVASAGFLSAADINEPLLLATLTFDIVGAGPTTISITGDGTNLDQGLQYLFSGNESFSAHTDVNVSAIAPEPGTLLLSVIGAGLLALQAIRSRRQRQTTADAR